jgi:hypothetical protein
MRLKKYTLHTLGPPVTGDSASGWYSVSGPAVVGHHSGLLGPVWGPACEASSLPLSWGTATLFTGIATDRTYRIPAPCIAPSLSSPCRCRRRRLPSPLPPTSLITNHAVLHRQNFHPPIPPLTLRSSQRGPMARPVDLPGPHRPLRSPQQLNHHPV